MPSGLVSLRHVYLHLDRRGVFAVDLASRSGSRFDGAPPRRRSAWLRPGRGLELAGFRVELLEAVLDADSGPIDADPRPDLLAEAEGLPPLELVPEDAPDRPLDLLSELSFLGRSRSCAVRCEGDGVARVHAVLVRSGDGLYVVNLAGPGLTIDGTPPACAAPIRDGTRLALGRSRFIVRLLPSRPPRVATTAAIAVAAPIPVPAPFSASMETSVAWVAAAPEPGEVLITQALQAVRDGQDELRRTNDQMQQAVVAAVRQLYFEQSDLFERHLERLDRLQREVAELRDELRQRLGPGATTPAGIPSSALEPPDLPPLEAPRTAPMPAPGRATSWLLDRVRELEAEVDQEARSGWRDLFARLSPPLRARGNA